MIKSTRMLIQTRHSIIHTRHSVVDLAIFEGGTNEAWKPTSKEPSWEAFLGRGMSPAYQLGLGAL